MKKIFLSLIAIMMAESILMTSALSINTSAAEAQPTATNIVYYSDLFYGYDTFYLRENVLLSTHAKETSLILADIYNDYADSDKFLWTQIKSSLATATNIKEWVNLVASTYGSTDYIYEKALDSANKAFATELLGRNKTSEIFGSGAKIVSQYKALVDVFNKFEQNFDITVMTETEIYHEFLAVLKNESIFHYISKTTITQIEELVLTDVSGYTKMLSNSGKALKAAQVLAVGLALEDARMEIIDEVIASAPKESVIYEGMSRLKNQLSGKFVTYFWTNYVEDGLLSKFGGAIVEKILRSSSDATFGWYEVVTAGIDLASMIVFDLICNTPGIDDMTTQKVLTAYADDLYYLVQDKISAFDVQLDSEDILTFESVFDSYIAATNAALKKSKDFALDSNRAELNRVTSVWCTFSYAEYTENVMQEIALTPSGARKEKFFDEWTNLNGVFKVASNVIEPDSVYLFNGALNANVKFTANSTVASESDVIALINGNVDICTPLDDSYDGTSINKTTVTITTNSRITITGDLMVGGGGFKNEHLENNGILTCLGDVNFTYSSKDGAGYYVPSANSKLIVLGNLHVDRISNDKITQGTIVFAGSQQQEIYLPMAYNIEVTNSEGIKYLCELELHGKYDLNENPLDLNGFCTSLAGENSELDSSNFYEVKIDNYTIKNGQSQQSYTLKHNIKGNVHIYNDSPEGSGELGNLGVVIPAGYAVKIDGNLIVEGIYYDAELINNGVLICEKDVTFIETGTGWSDGRGKYIPSKDSRLIAKGNMTYEYTKNDSQVGGYSIIREGTIEFAGTRQQEVSLPQAGNIEVTNPMGIKYLRSIEVRGNYKLNGNPLDINGFYTSIWGEFDESNFHELALWGDQTVKNNINANVNICGTLTIPNGNKVEINGDVYGGKLINNGILVCNGDLTCDKYKNSGYYQQTSDEARLIAKGNLNITSSNKNRYGTIELAGTGKQEVKIGSAFVVEISNTSVEGVIFTSELYVRKLFNHKGNNFTLYKNGSTSTFVDYDGDGLLDNVDPSPLDPQSSIEYTVIFKNWDGEVLSTNIYHWGDEVIIPKNPIRESNNGYNYAFEGWDKEVVNCEGDAVYTAVYKMLYMQGDIDGVGGITDADAEYLLMYTFFPEDYPVNQICDFNGDTFVNDADAEHLLMYTFFPEDYPLH